MTLHKFLLLIFIALITQLTATAQIPPARYKPTPMEAQVTMAQAIENKTADYQTSKDPKNESVVYKGIFSYREMEQEPTFSWLPRGMDEYKPDAEAAAYLKEHLGSYKVLIFLGTWCGDSKDLLPKCYKTLNTINLNYENLMMVGMDRDKTTTTKTGKKLIRKYKVSLLPTIILLSDSGKEAGRITETVNKSIEQDLADIIKKDKSE